MWSLTAKAERYEVNPGGEAHISLDRNEDQGALRDLLPGLSPGEDAGVEVKRCGRARLSQADQGDLELHELHEGKRLPHEGQRNSFKSKDTAGNENKKPKKRHPTERC